MTDPATPEGRAELRRLCEAATPGDWRWWTSCSWRRLRASAGGRDTSVIEPHIARDGHPDCIVSSADMALIEAAHAALPAALDLIEAQAVEIEALMDALPPAQELRSRTAASLRTILAAIPDHPDNARVDEFGAAMKVKLAKKRGEGRGGWDEPTVCTVDSLAAQLIDHLRKGDPVDVGNLAMMLFHRGGHDALARAAASGAAVIREEGRQEIARLTSKILRDMHALWGVGQPSDHRLGKLIIASLGGVSGYRADTTALAAVIARIEP